MQVLYAAEPQQDYLHSAVVSILQLHCSMGPGDILVFLTGREEIESVQVISHLLVSWLELSSPPAGCPEGVSVNVPLQLARYTRSASVRSSTFTSSATSFQTCTPGNQTIDF